MQKMKNIELVSSKHRAPGLCKTLNRGFILKKLINTLANSKADRAISS